MLTSPSLVPNPVSLSVFLIARFSLAAPTWTLLVRVAEPKNCAQVICEVEPLFMTLAWSVQSISLPAKFPVVKKPVFPK